MTTHRPLRRAHQAHERLRDLLALLLVLAAVGIVWLTLPVYAVGAERVALASTGADKATTASTAPSAKR